MDEKTLAALTALAQKLGTTAEYLWSVLLRQAPITGAIDLAVTVAWIAAVVWWARFVQRKTAVPPKTSENPYPNAAWTDDGFAAEAWVSVVVGVLLCAAIAGATLSDTLSALLNPEYWALKQILK